MKFSSQAGFVALAVLPYLTAAAPTQLLEYGPIDVKDRYIITLKDDADLDRHLQDVDDIHTAAADPSFTGVSHRYNNSIVGYAGHFPSHVAAQLQTHSDVESIEPDSIWHTATIPGVPMPKLPIPMPRPKMPNLPGPHLPNIPMPKVPKVPGLPRIKTQHNAPPNLVLISHRGIGRDEKGFSYDSSAGRGAYAYVVDTGIDISHREFEGRAFDGYREFPRMPFVDRDGHGTQVAGVIGGKTYGVAKKAKMVNVKVMNSPKGAFRSILAGFDWAVKDVRAHKRYSRSVINLSITGPKSLSLNKAINNAWKLGITTVAAAGDDDKDTAESSPGGAKRAVTVGATDMSRRRAKNSNYGAGVALFAPGVDVETATIGGSGHWGGGGDHDHDGDHNGGHKGGHHKGGRKGGHDSDGSHDGDHDHDHDHNHDGGHKGGKGGDHDHDHDHDGEGDLWPPSPSPRRSLLARSISLLSKEKRSDNDAHTTVSGTGIAAAHVTGIAIYFQTMYRYPDIFAVQRFLESTATPKVVGDVKGSANRFAYNNGGQ